jgi:TolB protein
MSSPITILAILVMALAFLTPLGAQDGLTVLKVEPFTGGTGETAETFIRQTLEGTGDFRFAATGHKYVLLGESMGGKIVGTLRTADGKVLFKENYQSPNLRNNARQFADECVGTILGHPGIAMTQIAFVSEATGRKEIYLSDSDGTNVRQITRDDSSCVSPGLRTDAQALTFTSYVSGYPDVYMIELVTGNRRRILNAPGTNTGAAFSPDGNALVLTMSFAGNSELYLTNQTGGGGRRLTKTPFAECSACWAPEGGRILFTSTEKGFPQLKIMEVDTGRTQLLNTGYRYNTEPDWAPEGDRIAFTVKSGGALQVAVMDFTTRKVRLIGEGKDPCWGADGRHLLYVRGNELILENLFSKARRTIISNMGALAEPSWSR